MMNKDLKLAYECAKSVSADTPLGKAALEIYEKFCKDGNDDKDFSAISKVIGGDAWDYNRINLIYMFINCCSGYAKFSRGNRDIICF